MERVMDSVGQFKTVCVSLLWKLNKTMFFLKKNLLLPSSRRAHIPFSLADLQV